MDCRVCVCVFVQCSVGVLNGLSFQALRNFEKAVHLDPSNSEMWTEDLRWGQQLAMEKEHMATTKCTSTSDGSKEKEL